mmetsp:Transcript_5299/g.15537  ORF Transcript_5299/g.15537 Transcript_5299/m.15537 type:complete len:86 (+) Transcript_5299:443-700(+)
MTFSDMVARSDDKELEGTGASTKDRSEGEALFLDFLFCPAAVRCIPDHAHRRSQRPVKLQAPRLPRAFIFIGCIVAPPRSRTGSC